ncbi:glycoside hydrolase family 5 protein [Sulfurimonas diazotrophicus]|uniref:Cellulase family glycosylhydrolase n=1 Tax=Sulfurimonas diazotrophicus TaxID=3131939 RepID=A0ABZ3H8F2_9BACT
MLFGNTETKQEIRTTRSVHWPFPDRARGFNTTHEYLTPSIITKLHDWNVNVLRINIGSGKRKENRSFQKPKNDYEPVLKKIDSILPYCRQNKLGLIISLDDDPWRREKNNWSREGIRRYKNRLLEIWGMIAAKYALEPAILAYDVYNEPQYKRADSNVWNEEVMQSVIEKIRNHDKKISIIIEPGPWAFPESLESMKVFEDPNIIYSVHMYAPREYTHQGIRDLKALKGKLSYPGWLQMFSTSLPRYWDKELLIKYVREARRFQEKYNVRIFVSEFGVVRWAPGSAKWVKDSIEIFEQYGWDWCFHSYGAWNGFNPSFDPEDRVSLLSDGNKTTETLKVLLHYFKKNQLN